MNVYLAGSNIGTTEEKSTQKCKNNGNEKVFCKTEQCWGGNEKVGEEKERSGEAKT